jgi:hypothetical protein|nr:MAG TPA: hypothetical protein [Caudoviricetes sp.]
MVKIVIDKSCLTEKGGSSFDDTEILNRLKALENRTDNFVKDVTVSRDGNKVKLTYTRVDGSSSEVEFDDKDTVSVAYDDTALKERVQALEAKEDKDTVYDDSALKDRVEALENKPDKDTVYDDSELKARVTALEAKEDSDKQTLSLNGNELSISNGNSVTLPEATPYNDKPLVDRIAVLEAKEDKDTVYDDTALKERVTALEEKVDKDTITKVTSTTEGVTVTPATEDNVTTYDVNLDEALGKFYKKAETYTKQEVDKIVKDQEAKSTDITVYRGTFTNREIVQEGTYDTDVSPRITLTYSSSTGVGILKVDFKILKAVGQGNVIAKLPTGAPRPAELIESQVWVGDVSTSIWVDKGADVVRMYATSDANIFNKRIILNIPGIFKK